MDASVEGSYNSLPFGDTYVSTGTDDDPYHFAGQDQDSESGTQHVQFRQYSSAQGRWLSPDPYDGSYDLNNPQSLNRYAYVLNNPSTLVDPQGLECHDVGKNSVCTVTAVEDPFDYFYYYGWYFAFYANLATTPETIGGGGGGRAPNNGVNTKHLACAADAAINFGLGFIPGYNAAKLIGQAAGLNYNFIQNGLSGKSIITAGPTPFSAAAALGSAYSLIKTMNFNDAGGMQQFTKLTSLTGGGWNNARTAIVGLEKAASTAGTVAQLLNGASAAYDIYQCYQKL